MIAGILHNLPLLAFTLAHPWMLAWLAAGAAPIVIHLLSRRRYSETTWAAMEYLASALRETRRRLFMEHWLLLAVRTLIVVLVVLAVAEPLQNRSGLAAATGERRHRVLVLDGSFSMAYTAGDKSRFERAKEIAARIVRESAEGDGFTLVLMSSPPRVVIGKPALEPQDFLKELHLLELPHTTADLPGTVGEVERVLSAARREEPRLTREEVYFLTDLGRVGWGMDRVGAAALAEFRKRSERLAESASLVVIDVGQPAAENLAVTSIRARDSFAARSRDFQVEATVKSFSARAHSRQPVELLADGRRVTQQTVDVPANGEASVQFSYRFETPGDHVLEVRAEGDWLDVDNHRWLAVPVKESIPVLCVDGRSGPGSPEAATRYLAVALAPAGPSRNALPASESTRPGESPLVRVEVVAESRLSEMPLERFDCVFLADVSQFTAAEARLLETYVTGGGSLVFFLGDRVDRDRYNAELGDERPGRMRLLPARLGAIIDRAESRLNPMDYRHAIVEPFRGRERSGLLTSPVGKHVRLTLPERSKAQVVLALASGDPLVVEEPIGRGRVVLVATSADTTWTYLPLWPSYVPLVQEMLRFVIGAQIERRNLLVGEPLSGVVPANAPEGSMVVRTPQGRAETISPRLDAGLRVWTYADTLVSGPFSVGWVPGPSTSSQHRDASSAFQAFAVNVDPIESDLTPITVEQLRDEVWPGIAFVHRTTWQGLDRPMFGSASRSSPWAKELLCGVLVLLLVETILARRFGHHD